MPLLIDGHNLIGSGSIPDISLADEDDEAKLVARLRVWRSKVKDRMTVIFDHGITGGRSIGLSGAGVNVIFARNPQDADELIRRRLRKDSQGLILVSNDAELRRDAAAADVQVWRSDEFVQRMQTKTRKKGAKAPEAGQEAGAESHVNLSEREVDQWMRLFGKSQKSGKESSKESSK
ncbi:MAG: NYN domain-containing protein [Caldilineaceae bacterium]